MATDRSSASPGIMPVTVHPPSPQVSLSGGGGTEETMSVSGYPHQPVIPRKPMHRSISVPLNARMGALRHPRPLQSPSSPLESSSSSSPSAAVGPHTVPPSPVNVGNPQAIAKLLRRPVRSRTSLTEVSDGDDATTAASESLTALLAHLILDALQLPISHLLHIIPPHLLDESHEVLSATSLAMPVTSIEAFMESFRAINWLCDAFVEGQPHSLTDTDSQQQADLTTQSSTEGSSSLGETASAQSSSSPSAGSREFTTADSVTSEAPSDSVTSPDTSGTSLPDTSSATPKRPVFDVFELSQRVADVVSGQAANRGIELILSLNGLAGEEGLLAGMQSLADGDGEAIRYLLIHTLSRLIELTPPLSIIEFALKIAPDTKGKNREGAFPCVFELRVLLPRGTSDVPDLALFHPESAVLQMANAQWSISHEAHRNTFSAILAFTGLRVVPSEVDDNSLTRSSEDTYERQRFLPHISLAEEPSPAQLSAFSSFGLQGKRVALHSTKGSPFARNLVGLLQACGCDVSHIPIAGAFGAEMSHASSSSTSDTQGAAARTAVAISAGRPAFVRYSTAMGIENHISGNAGDAPQTAVLDPVTGVPITLAQPLALPPQHEAQDEGTVPTSAEMDRDASSETITMTRHAGSQHEMEAFSFVMVDDDIDTLQRELLRLSTALPVLRGALGQQTPLPDKDRSGFAFGPSPHSSKTSSVKDGEDLTHAIVYFTSLKNFRSVRDLVQPIMESAIQAMGDRSAETMPEIIIVPKPAGHRRIITALHSAVHKIVVDPFFAPLATAPMLPHWIEAAQMNRELAASLPPKRSPSQPRSASRPRLQSAKTSPIKARSALGTPNGGNVLRLSDLPRADPTAMGLQPPPSPLDPPPKTKAAEPLPASKALGGHLAEKAILPTPSTELPRSQVSSSQSSFVPGRRSSNGGNSPMPVEALEYFSETAARMGTTGSSGMVIQSPDGRPAGIFFHPKTSTPGSTRSVSGRKGTPTGSISGRIGPDARRRSAENASVSSVQAQPLQSLAGALEKAGLTQHSDDAGAEKSSSASSVASGRSAPASSGMLADGVGSPVGSTSSTARAQRWAEAAPGTIFSPQVGIETVLQSGKMPLATPISQRTPSFVRRTREEDDTDANDEQTSALSGGGKEPDTKQPVDDDEEDEEVAREQRRISPRARGPFDDDDDDDADLDSRGGNRATGDQGGPGDEDGRPDRSARNRTREASQSRDGPNLPGPGASRPSAQPQPGIMIGAGFASSGRRGGGVRRPQKREKVLPPIKVLIVEDNVINQRILEQFMKKKKIQFEIAGNGLQAVEKWQQGSFHLILMDIQLPVMDGIAATKEIRRQETLANVGVLPATPPVSTATSGHGQNRMELRTPAASDSVPSTPFRASVIIVALTASVLNSDRVEALAAGCNDFLNKPVSLPWLEKKIIEWGSMQYILLSGAGVFDNERRNTRGISRSQGALAAAAANSDIRKAFGKAPDAKAKVLASKLHLPPKRTASPAAQAQAQAQAQKAPPVTQDHTLPVEEAEKIPAVEVAATGTVGKDEDGAAGGNGEAGGADAGGPAEEKQDGAVEK